MTGASSADNRLPRSRESIFDILRLRLLALVVSERLVIFLLDYFERLAGGDSGALEGNIRH